MSRFERPNAIGLIGLLLLASTAIASVVLALTPSATDRLLATPAGRVPYQSPVLVARAAPVDAKLIQSASLFHPARQYFEPPPVTTAPPRPDYMVAGVLAAPGGKAVAILSQRATQATRRVKAGEDLDGWTVAAIERSRVTLRFEQEQFDLLGATASAQTGLARRPLQRGAPGAAGGVRVLGSASSVGGGAPTEPPAQARLYRPPPQ